MPVASTPLGKRRCIRVEEARKNIANLLGAEDASQIFFTSGQPESANWVINMMPEGTLISPYEHNAIREPALRRGFGIAECKDGKFIVPSDCPAFWTLTVCTETGLIYDFPGDFQGIKVAGHHKLLGR
ncbi:MAG: aminotransferase class V-fold PLP-dependent enzyme [Fimbriimonadaceae bacterium]